VLTVKKLLCDKEILLCHDLKYLGPRAVNKKKKKKIPT
jgi:hypothetical protein